MKQDKANSGRIKVKTLPHGQTTEEGRFFVKVDGQKVGWGGRAFWPSRAEAIRCGMRNLTNKLAS